MESSLVSLGSSLGMGTSGPRHQSQNRRKEFPQDVHGPLEAAATRGSCRIPGWTRQAASAASLGALCLSVRLCCLKPTLRRPEHPKHEQTCQTSQSFSDMMEGPPGCRERVREQRARTSYVERQQIFHVSWFLNPSRFRLPEGGMGAWNLKGTKHAVCIKCLMRFIGRLQHSPVVTAGAEAGDQSRRCSMVGH